MTERAYIGREQSGVKHYFLKHYLMVLLRNVLWSPKIVEFVYVDGFAGPWQSKDEQLADTSVSIALHELRNVKAQFRKEFARDITFKAVFVEENADAFSRLTELTKKFPEIQTKTIHGTFEDQIGEIVSFCGTAFALTFIDPTGWTGFPRDKLQKLLRRPGEVIVNFMYDHINRHISDGRESIRETFDGLFGDLPLVQRKLSEEQDRHARPELLVDLYRRELKEYGNYRHTASTCIYKPTADRPHFFLVFGTNHPKGLRVFRDIERKLVEVQEGSRTLAKERKREQRSLTQDMLAGESAPRLNLALEESRRRNLILAREAMIRECQLRQKNQFRDLWPLALEFRLISYADARNIAAQLRDDHLISYSLPPKKRKIQEDTIVEWSEP